MQGVESRRVPPSVVAAAIAGNALEFFDFIAYAYFAVYIGQAFFPAKTEFMQLLLSVGVFGVGFVFRPLGGIVIGAYADRAGRRPAMLLTITLITVGTLGLAVTPSYATIGMAAPVIVVLCRLVQGLALGGEVGPSSAFLIEIAPPGRRGLYASWQLASQGVAALLAGGAGFALSLLLDRAQLAAWGWRVPFVLGLALVPIAIYLRRVMPETLEGTRASRPPRTPLLPHAGFIALAVLVLVGGTVSTYVANYLTTYALTTLKFPPSTALAATIVVGAVTFAGALLGGWMSDRWGRRGTMLVPRVLFTLVAWPLFWLLAKQPSAFTLYLTAVVLMGLTAISGAASLIAIPELLPRSVRSTGLSIAYAIGVSLFGGTTQFVVTWLLKVTGDATSPAWYVTAASLLTVLAMFAMPESRDKKLES